jgi:hypothetical protein
LSSENRPVVARRLEDDPGLQLRRPAAELRRGDTDDPLLRDRAAPHQKIGAAERRIAAERQRHRRAVERRARVEVDRARGREVAVLDVVRSLHDIDALDRLRDQPVEVGEAI